MNPMQNAKCAETLISKQENIHLDLIPIVCYDSDSGTILHQCGIFLFRHVANLVFS